MTHLIQRLQVFKKIFDQHVSNLMNNQTKYWCHFARSLSPDVNWRLAIKI